ncbi:type III-A CRISPR-associated protein Csm2 [Clostridium sp. D2Q-14]|uniref:type III-A CRISPR-associated protein Csm2 n=1 Tax=Anaeromonas gelatinilytica TaxID=2683194 RepID=UPI00193B2212|nr:type III-A CRISPR-associated protein Csm2 [Anaeromonas gelatinilytica]MBS4534146.1 type III-A CRISPR-associated protein Csm2 [Anaeromonas gelatinilytica]
MKIVTGKIESFNNSKKFGFINYNDVDKNVFFHISNVNYAPVKEGDTVKFTVTKGKKSPKGEERLEAKNIEKIEDELITYFKENVLVMDTVDDYDKFCDNALKYAKRICKGEIETSMIRKIYTRILAAKDVRALKMLRPQFAYTAGREEKNKELKDFMDLLDYIVKSMEYENEQQLENFKRFMESIVAYRKYVGKDK